MSNNLSAQRNYVVISKTYESGTPLYQYAVWSRETGTVVMRGFETYTEPELCARDAQEALDLVESGSFADEMPSQFYVGSLFYTQDYGC